MADKIYKNQTALTLSLETGIDLTSAVTVVQKWIDPDGVTGEWVSTVREPATAGIIDFVVPDSATLGKSGKWKRWAHVTFAAGTVAPGDFEIFTVYEEGL